MDNDVGYFYDAKFEGTLLERFQRKREKNSCNEIFMGENTLLDRLVVMDDVSGLADKSENFANFLKFRFTCIYIFQTIYPARNNW